MISLLISIAVLIAGYFIYGRFTEKIFSPDDRLFGPIVFLWIVLGSILGCAFSAILFAVYLVLLIKRCKKAKDGTSLS